MISRLAIAPPSAEQHPTGFGVGNATPRLSWRFLNTKEACPLGWEQASYEIQILRSQGSPIETYEVASDKSVLVPWPSSPLQSRESVQVRVRAHGTCIKEAQAEPTNWSPWSTIECALLHRHDWKGLPIASLEAPPHDAPLRPVRFRKCFHISGTDAISRARLYITSLGVYRAFINGQVVGDQCMAPGWTSYRHRLNYQVFDVTDLLNPSGPNVIAVEVGEGWYATRLGFRGGRRKLYGDKLAVLAQLEVQSEQDKSFSLATDSTWTCHPSAILRSELYDGEVYDAREENPSWNSAPESKDSSWNPVQELEFPSATLVAPDAPPVRVTEEIKAVEVLHTPSGKTVVDFGQNLVGRLLVRCINKPEGERVTFTHAEVLEHGELGTRPLRAAKCRDEFISAGKEVTDWTPQHTFHGFRYVQVEGWTDQDPPLLTNLVALVMHTDLTRSGWFQCSHPMVNQLHQNAWWSMRGNFLSIPTDCPQRDERLGWTGDIQVFCPSANFLYNTAGMLGHWLEDVAAEQLKEGNGCVPPFIVPNVISEELWPHHVPQAIWDDVVVLTPWILYLSYGDTDILRRQYASMLAWIDRGIQRAPDGLWDPEVWQLGDWLDPTAPPVEPGDARTDGTLVADAYLVHVTSVMAQVSEVLGETADATRFQADSNRLKATFQDKYIARSGLLAGDTQTALSLALMYDLHATTDQAIEAANRLVRLVRQAKFRVATGFAGTPIIAHALTKTGHQQIAYRMLLEKSRPSWMYPITMGATTIWERWDSMLPDGSINPGEMTSFNHYALGSIINWLHYSVAGVRPIAPGWKQFRVEPIPGGSIDSAEVAYETPYGRIECRWAFDAAEDRFSLDLLVPPNSRALVILPSEERWEKRVALKADDEDGTWIGSGHHQFSCRWSVGSHRGEWPPKPIIPIMRKPGPETIA
ncbi:alpha-L-rhamnosidase [Aspergillus parasiticus SU-1]|uniref:alpha-L-rhamnosidase n=1 Tax=Aspergillus parasiticus (strain ATCC 56775 / NRRL 5862 / SRRC 143 / SU-1) TaxID=1403190 RepID=A0A0F0IBV2_ASPPU|nr:alpha-L-rhamnosidase [Aspergillus parasiticus SU-1]